ncbi:unnamed protein product [Triticum turgidum subsp. durum]|uniref:Uncharacterized protein n=1 Tax=Triticum turgidum subsp. durum TaxID=4567 RepID=A0A9R0YC56_TRITD|nr:unnamed protein product [Triticum turgidum subsp. durum]
MTLKLLMEVSPQELLESLAELQNHVLGYVKATSLKCAVDLGIPAAIHKRGGTATLADIAADAKVHPAKVADLRRMMALLSASGIFTTTTAAGAGDDDGAADDTAAMQYGLTTTGRFLVGWRNLSPVAPFFVNPLIVSSFFDLPAWLRSEPAPAGAGSLFEQAHGCSRQEMAGRDAGFGGVLRDAMTADSELFLEVIIVDKGRIFRGVSSLVDVGAGNGAGTRVVAKAFPRIKCTVLDLPQSVGQAAAAGEDNLRFVAGDMFESIPPADAVLLKVGIHGSHVLAPRGHVNDKFHSVSFSSVLSKHSTQVLYRANNVYLYISAKSSLYIRSRMFCMTGATTTASRYFNVARKPSPQGAPKGR